MHHPKHTMSLLIDLVVVFGYLASPPPCTSVDSLLLGRVPQNSHLLATVPGPAPNTCTHWMVPWPGPGTHTHWMLFLDFLRMSWMPSSTLVMS